MSLPCDECLVFTLCSERYRGKNVVFCDRLREYARDQFLKDEKWFELRRKFHNTNIEMIAEESLEKDQSGELIWSKV